MARFWMVEDLRQPASWDAGLAGLFRLPLHRADPDAGDGTMTEDNDTCACEVCGAQADIETMSSCGDGCWMCPDCADKARAEFKACDHQWSAATDAFGEPAQFCSRCSHIVLDEKFPALFGKLPLSPSAVER